MRRRPLPDPLDGRPFSRRGALELGADDRRLRRADLASPFWGVRLPIELADDSLARIAALATRLPRGAAFSHTTAATLLGAPVPRALQDDPILHVTRPWPGRVTGRGIAGHSIDPALHDWELLAIPFGESTAWVPVTSPAATWVACSELLGVDALVALGDAFVARARVRVPVAALELAEAAARGRRGAAARREAIPLVRAGSWSPMETFRRLTVVRAGLPEPLLNVAVLDRNGNELGKPDEQWPAFGVLEEYEGERHRDTRQFRRDIARDTRYRDAGWITLKVTSDDVHRDPNPSLARLARALTSRGWRCPPGVPRPVEPIER